MVKTVGELKKSLYWVGDDVEVVLHVTTDGGDSVHLLSVESCSVDSRSGKDEFAIVAYAVDDPEGEKDDEKGLREVEAVILRDIETAEKGVAYFREQGHDEMVRVTRAEKKLLEHVLGYVQVALKS